MSDSYAKDFFAIVKALKNSPELPEPLALHILSACGKFPEDWQRGKQMQNELGFDAIPPVCECEIGAGFWWRVIQNREPCK